MPRLFALAHAAQFPDCNVNPGCPARIPGCFDMLLLLYQPCPTGKLALFFRALYGGLMS